MRNRKNFILRTALFAAIWAALLHICAADAAEPVRIGVMRFVSKADGVSEQQISQITESATRALFGSKLITVVEREKLSLVASQNKINTQGTADTDAAIKIGKLAGCQYMLLGAMTQLTVRTTHVGKGARLRILIDKSQEGRDETELAYTAGLEVRLIDVATGRVVTSMPIKGEGRAIRVNSDATNGEMRATEPESDALSLAISSAGTRLGDKVREILTGETPAVIDVKDDEVRINRGETSGAGPGVFYRVYRDGPEVRDADGSSLGRRRDTLAIVCVSEVYDEFSAAELVENGGSLSLVNRGDKVEAITIREAEALLDRGIEFSNAPVSGVGGVASHSVSAEPPAPASTPMPAPTAPTPEPAIATPHAPAGPAPTEAPVPAQPAVTIPSTASDAAPHSRPLENDSTDPGKVISTYPLSSADSNYRRIAHINFRKIGRTKEAYDKFVELYESYSGDYLAAYWLGEISSSLNQKDTAAEWYNKALAINPDYEPAKKALAKLGGGSKK